MLTATLLAVAAHARAQDASAGAEDAARSWPAPIEVRDEKQDKKKDKKSKAEKHAIAITDDGVFGVKGRVFTEVRYRRAERVIVDAMGMPRPTDVDSLDLVLDSGRVALLYQAPFEWLNAELEFELSDPDQVEFRDVYMLAEGHGFHAKVGNFKVPTSEIELESAWDLPIARRGLINRLLENYLAIAGRAPGIQVGYENRDGIEPKLMLGMFQGSVLIEQVGDDRDLELIEETTLDAQHWVARGAVELGDFDVGVFFEHRVGSKAPLQTEHYPVVGGDVRYDEKFGEFGFRTWLDAHYGESWYAHTSKPADDGAPWFLALRAILAARYGGTSDETFYTEIFTQLGMLDPDLDVTADQAWEISAGFNVGLWDRARLTLEGFVNDTSRNFSEGYFGGPRSQSLGLTLQAGMVL